MDRRMTNPRGLEAPVRDWDFLGVAIKRGVAGDFDSSVTGDPCVVWDGDSRKYHMFYFAQRHDDRTGCEVNVNAHAVSPNIASGTNWKKTGPLVYTNPDALANLHTSKPWILMDPYRPGTPVRLGKNYRLFAIARRDGRKFIFTAASASLEGPWTIQPEPVLAPVEQGSFDGYHVDTVTAYWFEERASVLLFYKGYPFMPQQDQSNAPYGSSTAVAVMGPEDRTARRLGRVLTPISDQGAWASGWIGGLQLLPAQRGGWFGLINASPTPPASPEVEPEMREPAPSLGGWAYTPEAWPISGWIIESEPIMDIDSLCEEASSRGVKENLWRHHICVPVDSGTSRDRFLFFNSGPYGQEQLFVWKARQQSASHA